MIRKARETRSWSWNHYLGGTGGGLAEEGNIPRKYLAGGIPTPLKNMKVSWEYDS